MTENYESDTLRRRGRKVAAILAGGLVLGVGTMATLASWSDSEFATGTFTAGRFNLEGSTDGSAFSDHAASPGAALPFTIPLSTNLTPTDTVYAGFSVRLAANTTNDATVTVTAPGTTGSVANLKYALIQTSSFGCTAATTGTNLVAAGTSVGTVPASTTFSLSKGSPTTSAGGTVHLCFKVTADSSLGQGQTGTATWQFQAVSS